MPRLKLAGHANREKQENTFIMYDQRKTTNPRNFF